MNPVQEAFAFEYVVAWALDIDGDIEVDILPPSMLRRGVVPRSGNVWLIFSQPDDELGNLASIASCLSDVEQQRAATFLFETDRLRYVRSHAFVRACLASLLGCHPAQIRFAATLNGKPVLAASSFHGSDLHFSLSRSGDVCVLAVSASPVGVDIERIRSIAEMRAIAMNLWGSVALERLDRIPDETGQAAAFIRWWTGHEATVKCSGAGLSDELADLPDAGSGRVGWLHGLPQLQAGPVA